MCGIAGVLSPEPLTEAERRTVIRMNDRLVHRGPDADGVFFDRRVGLAMRRLSIIDLQGGRQPVYNETRRIAAVCNGEIYNYRELRTDLEGRGHHLASHGDIETIVHLYEDDSVGCLSRLRGMFACALWDRDRQRLLLARDRMGEKPLYLYRDPAGRLWFASEMKSLLTAVPSDRRRLSPAAVNLFLTYQYVPEPMTMLESVEKLPAGHYLDLTPEQTAIVPRPYWSLLDRDKRSGNPIELVRHELEQASRIMGRADVPVGVALSGGIDSSVVAALSKRSGPARLQAFSVGYPGRPKNDERRIAAEFARQLDIPFHEAELETAGFIQNFPQLVQAMDDPIGDIAAYGYYAVAQLAREHGVPVLLSGLGGDEVFWGYPWVRTAVERSLRKGRLRWLSRRWPVLGRLVAGAGPDCLVLYDLHDGIVQDQAWARLMMPSETARSVPEDLWLACFTVRNWDRLPLRLLHVLHQTWLISNCLALADRLSMAHSIEMRLPLLDIGLLELVTGLREGGLEDWKRPHKWLLTESVRDLLPEEVLSRPKQGFTPPGIEWYAAIEQHYGHLLEYGSLVTDGLLERSKVEDIRRSAPLGFRYKLMLLEVWCRLLVKEARRTDLTSEAASVGARAA